MRRKKRAIQMQFVDATAPDDADPTPVIDTDALISSLERLGSRLITTGAVAVIGVMVVKTAADIVEHKLT